MKKRSFTLIEILVVIVVIGILSSFILIGINSITENARIAKIKGFANSLRNSLLTSIVFEWKLDGNANDSWGANNGTIGGSPTSISDCPYSSCYSFNGSSDYIYINDNDTIFDFETEMTAFLWTRGSVQQDSRGWFCQFNYGVGINERGWAMRPCGVTNSVLEVIINNQGDGSVRKNYRSTTALLNNKWHFIGFTWNNGTLKLYVDGLEETPSILYNDSFTTIYNSSAPISVGSFFASGSAAGFFNGDIDYVSLYNKAISSAQIQEKYYSGLNKLLTGEKIEKKEYNRKVGELENNLVKNNE